MYIYLALFGLVSAFLSYYLISSNVLQNLFLNKTEKLEEQLNLSYVFLNLSADNVNECEFKYVMSANRLNELLKI